MSGAWQWYGEAAEFWYWRAVFMFFGGVLPVFAMFWVALGPPTWWPTQVGKKGAVMRAKTVTATITIRPTYASAAEVRQEVEDSLVWLTEDHHAVTIVWGPDGEGDWVDEDDREDE